VRSDFDTVCCLFILFCPNSPKQECYSTRNACFSSRTNSVVPCTTCGVYSGRLYPPGDCNDTARKRQDRWKKKRMSFQRAGLDGEATALKRKSKEVENSQDGDPEHDVAAGNRPGPGAQQSQDSSGAGTEKKRPRTKKERLEAMQSQDLSQPSNTGSPKTSEQHQQVAETPERVQTASACDQLNSQGCVSQLGSQRAAVGHSQPKVAQPSPSVATLQARWPRTKCSQSEAMNSASQSPSSSASPGSQSPATQIQQENIMLQPGDHNQAGTAETCKRPRTKPAKLEAKRSSAAQRSTPAAQANNSQAMSDG
jgi:hypothetical protein